MTARVPRVSALTFRPLEGLLGAGGTTRWAATVGEAELLLRRLAAELPPGAPPRRFEAAVIFAGGARRGAEIALRREDAHREASPWEPVLHGWAKECIDSGDRLRTLQLARMAELVRHVAHDRAVSELVEVYERLDDIVDAEGAARRDRVLASPCPTPLAGSRYSEGRPLPIIARDVRRDIEAAVASGMLPEGLRCAVRVETYEAGPGIEVEVLRAPGLWIPDLCEMCVPIAYRVQAPPEGGPTCGHTPTLGGYSTAADGLLRSLLAIGDVYNCDTGRIEGGAYLVKSAFELATCFGGGVGRAQRESLRSSEQAMRDLARRRAALAAAPPSPPLPPGGTSCSPAEPPRTAP